MRHGSSAASAVDSVAAPTSAGDLDGAPLAWVVAGQSVAKPHNDYFQSAGGVVWRQNEDRFRVDGNRERLSVAVSDGAGSSGLFCGPWAETLVGRLPSAPIGRLDDLNSWIDGFWQAFSDEYKARAAGDAAKSSKFVQEGSFATLAACWLSKGEAGVTLYWCGYGDSPICVFRRGGSELALTACHPNGLGALAKAPHLLNWKDLPIESEFRAGTLELTEPATVLLASDGVGQFVLFRFLAEMHCRRASGALASRLDGPDRDLLDEFGGLLRSDAGALADVARTHLERPGDGVSGDFAALRDSLHSETAFGDLIRCHYEDGLLSNDDATLVMIDIDHHGGEGQTTEECL